jgi:hypothetical protein
MGNLLFGWHRVIQGSELERANGTDSRATRQGQPWTKYGAFRIIDRVSGKSSQSLRSVALWASGTILARPALKSGKIPPGLGLFLTNFPFLGIKTLDKAVGLCRFRAILTPNFGKISN